MNAPGPGLRVSRSLVIPESELVYRFSPSGGPGGQHANKTSTRAEVKWNVAASAVLGPRQRQRIQERLRHRIDSSGVIRLSSDAERSQLRNRAEVTRRLASLVADALRQPKRRVATGPTRASKAARLDAKKRRGDIKRARAKPTISD